MFKRALTMLSIMTICVAMLFGCGSTTNGSEQREEKYDLVFSDTKVECSKKDGWFGARYADIKVTSSVKNESENTVNEDNMPVLVTKDGETEVKPNLSQEKLLQGETCNITYENSFDVNQDELPTLSFSCKLSFTGLQDAEKAINDGLKNVVDEYANEDAKKEEENKAAEKEKEQAKKSVEDCKGKTADEAMTAAKKVNYQYEFKDSNGFDVKKDVEDSKNGSAVHKAVVQDVTINDSWFGDDTAVFTLDYTDPVAAEQVAKKSAATELLNNATGKTAAEIIDAAELLGVKYKLQDNHGNAVSNADNPAYAGARSRAVVAKVDGKWSKYDTTKVTLDRPLAISRDDDPSFAAVLDSADEFSDEIKEYANSHKGLNVEFDGYVAYIAPTGNTRYDILVYVGDAGDLIGPRFKIEDVNPGNDLKWSGSIPGSVTQDMNLHFIASVDGWGAGDLFMIDPVQTSVR